MRLKSRGWFSFIDYVSSEQVLLASALNRARSSSCLLSDWGKGLTTVRLNVKGQFQRSPPSSNFDKNRGSTIASVPWCHRINWNLFRGESGSEPPKCSAVVEDRCVIENPISFAVWQNFNSIFTMISEPLLIVSCLTSKHNPLNRMKRPHAWANIDGRLCDSDSLTLLNSGR